MKLLETARKFIEKERLFGVLDSVLVGVSGGKDSMCLLQVLHQLGYKISVAHVNYKLRGVESDKDEQLVVSYCQKLQIDCHVYSVTQEDAVMLKEQNFQESARDLRYEYFEKIRIENGYDKVAIAHHQNDVAETFLMNAMRGSGTGGLRSIQPVNKAVVRPLLRISRKEISIFIAKFNIPYRTDESNYGNKYSRNFIRNKIIPNLKKRWPGAIKGIGNSAKLLSNENQLLQYLISQEKSKWLVSTNTATQVGPLSELILIPGHESLLWHLLKDYRLSISTIENILDKHKSSGNDFSTLTHSIILDRNFIKIKSKESAQPLNIEINDTGEYQTLLGQFSIQTYNSNGSHYKCEEIVDSSKIIFPLILRKWEQGDKWKALGMKGRHKKVSDYLIDQKIDRLSKSKVLVLEDANEDIIWLVGHRISELIKTSRSTVSKLCISWKAAEL